MLNKYSQYLQSINTVKYLAQVDSLREKLTKKIVVNFFNFKSHQMGLPDEGLCKFFGSLSKIAPLRAILEYICLRI